jgi:hypothetical protein
MRAYLDTTALIFTRRLKVAPPAVTRPHSIAEFFSAVTRGGLTVIKDGVPIRAVMSRQRAIEEIGRVFAQVKFFELTGQQTLASLPGAVKSNVQGPTIRDWMHAEAAKLARCRAIVTSNQNDFKAITQIPLISPEDYFKRAKA